MAEIHQFPGSGRDPRRPIIRDEFSELDDHGSNKRKKSNIEEIPGSREIRKKVAAAKRRKFFAGAGVALLLLLLLFSGVRSLVNKTYTSFGIIEWKELDNVKNAQVISFGNNLLRYNKDGAALVKYSNEQVWNQPYQMQSPIVDICGDAAAIADKSGNKFYIFGQDGLKGEIETALPIEKITVSEVYSAAVLLKDGSTSRIHYYDNNGNLISEMKIGMEDMGYPMSIDLSPDGKMFLIAYLSVSDGNMNSVLSFYNFGTVGQEYSDRLVEAKTYEDMVFPTARFLSNSVSVAFSDRQAVLFEGSQIPVEKTVIEYEHPIRSIFTGKNGFGYVDQDSDPETPFHVHIFNMAGKEQGEIDTAFSYTAIKLEEKHLIMHNDRDFAIYTIGGKKKFEGAYDTVIRDVIPTSSSSRFYILTPTELNKIKLD